MMALIKGHYVAYEILENVAGRLPLEDIQRMRLTCSAFADVASRYLIDSLWISPTSADQQKMLAVAQHPVICKTIVEIKYDASWSIPEDPETSVPFCEASYVRHFTGQWARAGQRFSVSKAEAIRGYRRYKERKDEENSLATVYTGPNMTRYRDHGSLPEQFSMLLQQTESHSQVLKYLPSDLVTLITALPEMPMIRRFVVSDCRYSRTHEYSTLYSAGLDKSDRYKDLNYAFNHRALDALGAYVLEPRPWIANAEVYAPMSCRQVYRGFPVLMQAASMLEMNKLETFSIQRDSENSGLSCQLFDMSPSELHHSLRVFRHLRTLTLKLNEMVGPGTFQPGVSFDDVMRTGGLAQMCMAAQGLESLDVQLQGPCKEDVRDGFVPGLVTVASLNKLIGDSTWPKLTSVTLGWMMISKNDFLAFWNRQHHTIRRLTLIGVLLVPEIATRHPWQDAFIAMAADSTELEYLKVAIDPEEATEWEDYFSIHFKSEDQAAILRFLSSGSLDGKCSVPPGRGCTCPSHRG